MISEFDIDPKCIQGRRVKKSQKFCWFHVVPIHYYQGLLILLWLWHDSFTSEEVILAEERTTEEERQHIIEARKRTMNKRKKMMKNLGKGRSADTDEDEDEADDGEKI